MSFETTHSGIAFEADGQYVYLDAKSRSVASTRDRFEIIETQAPDGSYTSYRIDLLSRGEPIRIHTLALSNTPIKFSALDGYESKVVLSAVP